MPRTPVAALLRAALPITFVVAMLLAIAPSHAAAATRTACADRLCTKDKPGVASCRGLPGYRRQARCFIDRAARFYHQSERQAKAIAYRESRYQWWVANSSGHRGLYQFDRTLWRHTPYRSRSPFSPRFASLAAMWVWRHGGMYHWACC